MTGVDYVAVEVLTDERLTTVAGVDYVAVEVLTDERLTTVAGVDYVAVGGTDRRETYHSGRR